MTRVRRDLNPWALAVALTVVVVLVGACSTSTVSSGAGDPAESTSAPGVDGGDGGGSDGAATEGFYAVVTVGDQRFEFDLTAGNNGCGYQQPLVLHGGAFDAEADPTSNLGDPHTAGAHLNFAFVPEGDAYRVSQVVIEDFANDVEWWADPDTRRDGINPAATFFLDYSFDGDIVSGTTTFVDTDAARLAALEGRTIEPTPGSFEMFCGKGQEG